MCVFMYIFLSDDFMETFVQISAEGYTVKKELCARTDFRRTQLYIANPSRNNVSGLDAGDKEFAGPWLITEAKYKVSIDHCCNTCPDSLHDRTKDRTISN